MNAIIRNQRGVGNNQVNRKIFSIFLIMLMILNIFVVLWVSPNVTAADLVVSSTYTVSGTENWDDITVTGTGKLIVPTGATLNAQLVTLQPGSIFEATGGTVTITNPSAGGDARFTGTCQYFNVTNFSTIELTGSNGGSSVGISQGGDAEINVTGTMEINIENSTLDLQGGLGFSPSIPWTTGNLNGYVSAGGAANIYLDLTNTNRVLRLHNSNIYGQGGNGGNAPDGGLPSGNTKGEGGGFTNAGDVTDYVGAGGMASCKIFANSNTSFYQDTITLLGGNGGDAGNVPFMAYGPHSTCGDNIHYIYTDI